MYDPALTPLLERCTNEELAPLVDFLVEPITSTLKYDPDYRRAAPDHRQYIGAIVKEIRLFGGHSIKDRLDSGPVGRDYERAVSAALTELGVARTAQPTTLEARERLMVELLIDTEFEQLPQATQEELLGEFYRGEWFGEGLFKRGMFDEYLQRTPGQKHTLSLPKLARTLKSKTRGYVKGKLKGAVLKTGMKLILKRAAGPIGLALSGWSVLGPAWRVFIPVVCYVAYLRHLKGMDEHAGPVVAERGKKPHSSKGSPSK